MSDDKDLEEIYEDWIASLDRKIEKCDSPKRRLRLDILRSEVRVRLENIRKYGTPEGDYNVPVGVNIKT